MATLGKVPKDFEEAVRLLAAWHKREEPSIEAVYWFPDPEQKEVRLIEVTGATPPTGEAMVFGFAAFRDFPYRSAVGHVTPEEWEEIRRGQIPLPDGWDANQARRVEAAAA